MKGVVFTEFLDMVEERFGMLTLDETITKAKLGHSGGYTAVGTYDHAEMVRLVTALSETTQIEITDLLFEYGKHFFGVLAKSYPAFFAGQDSMFDFLEAIETYIHPEVLKLYPDAELPRFQSKRISPLHLEMRYFSSRKMSDFARGLIHGCISHFEEPATVSAQLIEPDGSVVQFEIVKAQ